MDGHLIPSIEPVQLQIQLCLFLHTGKVVRLYSGELIRLHSVKKDTGSKERHRLLNTVERSTT